jgi:hypothetical protein
MPSNTNTSLHIAIQNGNMEIINMLLADGCESLYVRNAEGQTPLDLATAMNNEEIVHLLLEHGAGHSFPQPPIYPLTAGILLDPERRKSRITFWTVAYILVNVVMTLAMSFYELAMIGVRSEFVGHPAYAEMTGVLGLLFMVFFVIPGTIASLIAFFFFILRLWEEVPREFARTTPKTAAWLSLIPIFWWYWMFVVLSGLYHDMNKTLVAYGCNTRFGTTLITAVCVYWVVDAVVSIMLGFASVITEMVAPGSPFSVSLSLCSIVFACLLYCAITVPMIWIVRSKVVEFIDIKRSLEG